MIFILLRDIGVQTFQCKANGFCNAKKSIIEIDDHTIRHVTLVVTTGTIILVPYLKVNSLQFIWRSGTRRWNLRVVDLQMNFSDLTIWQGIRLVVPPMAARVTCPISSCTFDPHALTCNCKTNTKYQPFWNIPGKLSQYNGCWCPGSYHHKTISHTW